MAATFGSRARAFLVAILIGLLVIAFAVWGVNDVFSPQSGNHVLKVGSSEVSGTEFNRAYRQRLTSMAEESKSALTDQQAFDRGVHRQVLSDLLARKIIEVDADDLGIGVNATTAKELLSEIPAFKDELTGKFSKERLFMALSGSRSGLTVDEYEKILITDLRQQQTLPAISGGVSAPIQFAEQRYQFITEQRQVKILTLTDAAVPPAPEPTEDDLKIFVEANAVRFTAPEYRRVTMLRMEPHDFVLMDDRSTNGVNDREKLKDVFNNVFVTEDQIQAAYDYRVELGDLGSPAKRSLLQITANSEENANDVAQKLRDGLSATDTTTFFGLIEPITYEDVTVDAILDDETAKAAFEMKKGEIKTILSGFGNWVAIQVTEASEAEKPDISTMKDEITQEILTAEASNRIYDVIGKVQDQIDDGRSLEEAAEIAQVPFASLPFIDRSGSTQDGLKLSGVRNFAGIAADNEVLKTIFTSDMGFESDYFDTATGGQAILRVDQTIESQRRPFAEVKDAATGQWKAEYVENSLNDLMIELTGKIRAGETLETVAAGIENGATIETINLVRATPDAKLGPQLNAELLEASKGEIERGNGPTRMTRQIARVEEITSNKDSLSGQYADLVQDQVTAEIISDLNLAYRQAVLQKYPLTESADRVKQIMGIDTGSE